MLRLIIGYDEGRGARSALTWAVGSISHHLMHHAARPVGTAPEVRRSRSVVTGVLERPQERRNG
jgi:hypothetical protein